jgi:hypothetical protein
VGRHKNIDDPLAALKAQKWALERQIRSQSSKLAAKRYPSIIPGKKGFQPKQALETFYGNRSKEQRKTLSQARSLALNSQPPTIEAICPDLCRVEVSSNDASDKNCHSSDASRGTNDVKANDNATLTQEERWLLEEGAKDVALWGATLLPHHITFPFAEFHREMLGLFRSLVLPNRTSIPPVAHEHNAQLNQPLPKMTRDTYIAQKEPVLRYSDSPGDALAPPAHDTTPLISDARTLTQPFFSVVDAMASPLPGYAAADATAHANLLPTDISKDSKNVDNLEGVVRCIEVLAPREHAKTTCLMVFVLWCICYRMRKFIVLLSDTEDQSKLQLDAIKNEIETNELMRRVYGDLQGPYWGLEGVETSTGIKVICKGAGQKVRGLKFREQRPDLVLCDDLLNDELVETEERRAKIKRWFFGALVPCVAPGGVLVVAGTLLHEADLMQELSESSEGWTVRRFEACALDGLELKEPVLWPGPWSLKRLEDKRQMYVEKGEASLFYREYFNRIVSNESSPFHKEYFQYIAGQEMSDLSVRNYLTVDPAYTIKKGSDLTVFCIVALSPENKWYVKALISGHWQIPRIVEQWFEVMRVYKPLAVGMQTQDWDRVFKPIMQDEMRRRNSHFGVKTLQTYSPIAKGLANKEARIGRLSKYYATRSIWHVKDGIGIEALEHELLAFPYSKHDDRSDALSMMVDLAFPPQKKKEREIPEWLEHGSIDPLSGYG